MSITVTEDGSRSPVEPWRSFARQCAPRAPNSPGAQSFIRNLDSATRSWPHMSWIRLWTDWVARRSDARRCTHAYNRPTLTDTESKLWWVSLVGLLLKQSIAATPIFPIVGLPPVTNILQIVIWAMYYLLFHMFKRNVSLLTIRLITRPCVSSCDTISHIGM